MGWLWSTSTTSPSAPIQSQEAKQSNPPSSIPESVPAPLSTNSKPLSQDELAEQELQSFLQELEADVRPSSTKYNRVPHPPPTRSPTHNNDGTEPISEQLLPKTMSCRTAFDEAFYCNSFGGRFNDLYRYGTLKSCSDNWNDFWFCMRTRGYGEKEKETAIREHYREKERMKYAKELGKESSEDVWRSRDKKLEWGEAFHLPLPKLEETDEEWNRKETEWRKGNVNGGSV